MTTETTAETPPYAITRSRSLLRWAGHAAWLVAFLGFTATVALAVAAPQIHVPEWVLVALTVLALVGE